MRLMGIYYNSFFPLTQINAKMSMVVPLKNRLRMITEIINGIRVQCGPDFRSVSV